MGDLNNDLTWPPTPILTDRLTLRSTRASDRASFIDLQCSSAVRQYLGGPLDREQIEDKAPAVPGNYPGMFAVADASGFVGMVLFDRRDQHQPGHIRPEGNELEVSYMLHERVWGQGYGSEAVAAALEWAGASLPDPDVILCTQLANRRSRRLAERLGFVEAGRFTAYDAEQWLGTRRLPGH